MRNDGQPPDPTGEELDAFREMQRKATPEELLPYAGKHVGWSVDSGRIVASGENMDEVEEKVVAAGFAPNRVVFGYVNDPEVSYL
jgi:hypothetical protein